MAAADGGDGPEFDAAARTQIEELVKKNKIVLFMKGNRWVGWWVSGEGVDG